jgi:hypothetical protein
MSKRSSRSGKGLTKEEVKREQVFPGHFWWQTWILTTIYSNRNFTTASLLLGIRFRILISGLGVLNSVKI